MFATPELMNGKVENAGSSYVKKAEEVVVRDAGHLVAFERVTEVAGLVGMFIEKQVEVWKKETEIFERKWAGRTRRERAGIDAAWKEKVGPPPARPKKEVKEKL